MRRFSPGLVLLPWLAETMQVAMPKEGDFVRLHDGQSMFKVMDNRFLGAAPKKK